MRRDILAAAFALCAASGLIAQTVRPTFEVASIKRNMSGSGGSGQSVRPGGTFTATNLTLLRLLEFAFDVRASQIVGGPDWVRTDRFDVMARASTDGPRDQIRSMVRTLLEDRFSLRIRSETREMPFFELLLARRDGRVGPNLHDCANPNDKGGISSPEKPFKAPPGGAVAAGDCSDLASLVSLASSQLQSMVVNRTGLTGRWRYDIYFSSGLSIQRSPNPDLPSFVEALREQLGLTLERTSGPVDVIVIEGVQPPTEN